MSSYDRLVPYPTPTTTLGIYGVVRSRTTGEAWNTDTELTEVWSDGTLNDYVIILPFLGGDSYGFTVPTALPNDTYVVLFFKPAAPGTYATTDLKLPENWEFGWNGAVVPAAPPGTPSSDLITDYAKFLRRWGEPAVILVSNKGVQNPTTVNTAAVQDAFDYADGEIYKALGGGPYTLPLVFTGGVPTTVEDWAFIIAYSYLYHGRFDDIDSNANEIELAQQRGQSAKVKNMVEVVYSSILEVRMGFATIDSATRGSSLDYQPQAVSDYDVKTTVLDDYSH